MTSTWILGGYQSDFARNLKREGLGLEGLTTEVVNGTIESAGVDLDMIETIHVGNAFGQLYTGQGHLGAMPATVFPGLSGVPAMRHEAACASASMAILAAAAELEAKRYGCALVLGIEQERTMPGAQAAQVQQAAALVGVETEHTNMIWPTVFDHVANEYDRRYGIDDLHLRAIGELNLTNAKANPLAQTRGWKLNADSFAADDLANPVVTGRLRRNDCCQITDGAVGLILVSDEWLAEHQIRPQARIAGWGHTTAGLALAPKLQASANDQYVMPHVRKAIVDARTRAGIADVDALDGIEVHDCMTPSQYLAIDHLGITAPGESWKAIEDGRIERSGALPINAGGGLIGGGHPVGATGARMVLDAAKHVSGSADGYQIDGAQRMQTLNIGGSTATTASFIVESVALAEAAR